MAAKKNLELGTQEDGVVPDWYLEPFGIRLPFGNKGATAYTVPDLPFQDLLRYDPTRVLLKRLLLKRFRKAESCLHRLGWMSLLSRVVLIRLLMVG